MTYTDRFAEVLAGCLEELGAGRATPAILAARHPEYPDLGALLALAAELWALPLPQPDPTRAATAALRVRQALEPHGDPSAVQSAASGAAAGDDLTLTASRPAGQPTLQRRRHVRLPVLLEGKLWLVQLDGARSGPSMPITIVDLSTGGMGFHSQEGLPPGAAVEIELRLPDQIPHQEGPEATSLLAVLGDRWPGRPRPRHARPARAGRAAHHKSARAAVLGAVARVVHCSSQLGTPLRGVPETPYRAGVEFVELRDLVASSRP